VVESLRRHTERCMGPGIVYGREQVFNFYADEPVVLAARWAAWRTATEGLAFFFLHQSVGLKVSEQGKKRKDKKQNSD
jgi:hypothetical protein